MNSEPCWSTSLPWITPHSCCPWINGLYYLVGFLKLIQHRNTPPRKPVFLLNSRPWHSNELLRVTNPECPPLQSRGKLTAPAFISKASNDLIKPAGRQSRAASHPPVTLVTGTDKCERGPDTEESQLLISKVSATGLPWSLCHCKEIFPGAVLSRDRSCISLPVHWVHHPLAQFSTEISSHGFWIHVQG